MAWILPLLESWKGDSVSGYFCVAKTAAVATVFDSTTIRAEVRVCLLAEGSCIASPPRFGLSDELVRVRGGIMLVFL